MASDLPVFRPLDAGKVTDLNALEYPLLGSRKIDGIRALVMHAGPVLKSIAPVPNCAIREALATLPRGFDGELAVVDAAGKPQGVRITQSAVMRGDVLPLFRYFVFDDFFSDDVFEDRAKDLAELEDLPAWVQIVPHFWIMNAEEAQRAFGEALELGYEGLVLRSPDAPYLLRRSTLRDQAMLKVKPWDDAEAEILGTLADAHGGVSALVVTSPLWPHSFRVPVLGRDRSRLAERSPVGKLARFRFVSTGGYDVPRHSVFMGLRDRRDMSPQ